MGADRTSVLPVHSAVDESTADFFGVLSSPIRLGVLRLLLDGERCVSDLVQALEVPQPRLSNHLACLRNCGLVRVRREGTYMFYALADPRLAALVNLGTTLAGPSAEALRSCPVLGEESQP
jgi:DNA-binding transcriptional ArsR family regulator